MGGLKMIFFLRNIFKDFFLDAMEKAEDSTRSQENYAFLRDEKL